MSADAVTVPDDTPITLLTLPLEVAAHIVCGASRATAYEMAQRGTLPVLPGPGRRRVPVGHLERILGRRITVSDLARAQESIAPRKAQYLARQAAYRAARAKQAEARAS